MELRYFLGGLRSKRIFFVVSAAEEEKVREVLETQGSGNQVFFSGKIHGPGHHLENRIGKRILQSKAELLVVTSQPIDSDAASEAVFEAHLAGIRVMDLDRFLLEFDPSVEASPDKLIHSICLNGVPQDWGVRIYESVKYLLEPALALLLLLMLSPILVGVVVLMKLTSPGPLIYSQERVGFRSRIFRIYKFRSMRTDAESDGPVWASAVRGDPRLTVIGGFLRSTHLDELPQLWNIARGELSFIGPRPERPEFVKILQEKYPLFRLRTLIKPGITGWAQIKQGYANTLNDSLRKLEFDLFYMIKNSPKLDFKIIFGTLSILMNGGTEGVKRSRALVPAPIRSSQPAVEKKEMKAS